jgi:hypothetical protein
MQNGNGNAPDESLSREGEPLIQFGVVEAAGKKAVVMQIQSGGLGSQVVLRPAVAERVGDALAEMARQAKSGLTIARPGEVPPSMN